MQAKEEMLSVLKDFQESGMSMKAYANQAGVPYYRLQYWWRKIIKKENSSKKKVGSFLPVTVKEPIQSQVKHPQVELSFPGGLEIKIFYA